MSALRARLRRLPQDLRRAFAWFASSPAPPQPLAVLRIAVSVFALLQVWLLWPYLHQLYGNFGFVQWVILETSPETWLPSIGKVCLALQPYGVSSAACVNGVFGIYALSLVGLALGWRTRACAAVAWMAHTLTINSGYLSLYGVDTMVHICLFYLVWMPAGEAFSMDQRRRRRPPTPSAGAGLALRTFQIHLCVIYLNAGTAKMRGEQWWNGEAIWRALINPEFGGAQFSWLAHLPLLAMGLGWATMLVEAGYAFFIWPRAVRPWWVAATVGLHLGIGATMGLWMFSIVMIIMTVSAFGLPLVDWTAAGQLSGAWRTRLPPKWAHRTWTGAVTRRS